MEFWSGILGAIVGGAIALIGTIFTSMYAFRCQMKSEQRQEKRKIYGGLCNILGKFHHISVIIDPEAKDGKLGNIDAEQYYGILNELSQYTADHAGDITLFLPNDICSSIMRIRAEIYHTVTNNTMETMDTIKYIARIIFELEAQIRMDLYST